MVFSSKMLEMMKMQSFIPLVIRHISALNCFEGRIGRLLFRKSLRFNIERFINVYVCKKCASKVKRENSRKVKHAFATPSPKPS